MAIAYVQRAGTANSDVSSTTLAITVAGITIGHTLVVAVGCGGGRTVSSVADDAGNTYTVDATNASASDESAGIASTLVASAPTTITVTFNAAVTRKAASVDEFSGIATSSRVDTTAVTNGTWSLGLATGAAVTTTNADDVVVGVFAALSYANGATFGNSGSYIGLGYVASSATAKGCGVAYRIVSATGTHTPVAAVDAGSQSFREVTVAYKAAAGGATEDPYPYVGGGYFPTEG